MWIVQRESYELRSEIRISNVVTTADLKQKVNLQNFNKFKSLSSNLSLYKCGYVKDKKMIGRVSVFESGKLISVGTKNTSQSIYELENAVKILQKFKLVKPTKIFPIVRNIVSSAFLGKKLDLLALAVTLPKSIYEPDQFPAIIHSVYGSIVVLIFGSGKVIILGTKNIEEINKTFFELKHRIKNKKV